jgi:integrase
MATAYQKFYEVLKSPATIKSYEVHMKKFFNYAKTDYEELAKMDKESIEELMFGYITFLKRKTQKIGVPNPNSYNPIMAPIQTFLEQNDILLNWKKIKRWYPDKKEVSNQLPYLTEHIQQMLALVNCPRDVALIHLLACTAVRVGSVYAMKIQDIHFIDDGAVIEVTKSKTRPYRTCLTPECTTALKNYLDTRKNTSDNDALFTIRNNSRPLTNGSIKGFMKPIRNKIGLNEGKGKKSPKSISMNHGFRKRVEIIFAKAGIDSLFRKYMTNHEVTLSVHNYGRGVSDADLWNEYKKAIPELTVSDVARLDAKHKKEKEELTKEIPDNVKEKLESIEGQLVEMKQERAGKVIEFYDNLAEKRDADSIEDIKTKLDDIQIDEIKEAREILGAEALELSASQDLLRKKYLVRKQELVVSNLEKELSKLKLKIPKYQKKWEKIKFKDEKEDAEFTIWADAVEEYENKKEEFELAEEYLTELKKKV